jgi:hypothetical protein
MLKKTLILLLIFFLITPIFSASACNVFVRVRGGIGVRIIVDNYSDHNVTINFTINWTDIFGEHVDTEGGEVILGKMNSFEYGTIPVIPFIQRVSVHVEVEDKVVEKYGFSFFGLVLLHKKVYQ